MEEVLGALLVAGKIALGSVGIFLALVMLIFGFLFLIFFWVREVRKSLTFLRMRENPLLIPRPEHWWESEAVFNPGAVVHNGKVHLFYRALGQDGISRIGYALSHDGINFERFPHPVFEPTMSPPDPRRLSYAPLTYNTDIYASGGGWGGSEDPRAVKLEEELYMSFSMFEGWDSIRVALTSLPLQNLEKKVWSWKRPLRISPKGETHKNWVLFPEKIGDRFAVLHALTPNVLVEYVDSLEELERNPIRSNNRRGGRKGAWDSFVRGAAAPPIKTSEGWLLFYHAMDESHFGYKLGAMLLDLKDPTKIVYRSSYAVLEPKEWYENEWKQGVIYASGAVVLGGDLIIYYGGGDKHVAAARANLRDFLRRLTHDEHAVLTEARVSIHMA